MSEVNIRQLMETAMSSLLEMMDVNTVVGDMLETSSQISVIPISKVSCGFVAGGGEYGKQKQPEQDLPFAGGSGAGVTVAPVGFLVGHGNSVRFIAVNESSSLDRAIEALPGIIEQLKDFAAKN